jgi:hypothetical protein
MTRAGLCWPTLVLMAALLGCGRPSYKLVPVNGQVTYRGRGVSKATVQLLADTAKGTHAPTATGETDADGAFTLQTPPHGAGVVPGHYKVTVQHYHSSIPARYGNPARTPLHVEVTEAGLTDWKIQLKD